MSEQEDLGAFAARMKVFIKNRQEYPPEKLLAYEGQWVAWSPDGSAIVAASPESAGAVYEQLESAGHDSSLCCLSYVPAANERICGPISYFVHPPPNGDGSAG